MQVLRVRLDYLRVVGQEVNVKSRSYYQGLSSRGLRAQQSIASTGPQRFCADFLIPTTGEFPVLHASVHCGRGFGYSMEVGSTLGLIQALRGTGLPNKHFACWTDQIAR